LIMCGVHARKERELHREREAAAERRAAGDAHMDGSEDVCKRILENWGLHAKRSGYGIWDGTVSINHEELEILLEALEVKCLEQPQG
jgi:hypothetical protein